MRNFLIFIIRKGIDQLAIFKIPQRNIQKIFNFTKS